MSAVAEFLPPPPARAAPRPAPAPRRRLGRILREMDAISPDHLLSAVAMEARTRAPLAEILRAEGWVAEPALLAALARLWGRPVADLKATPVDRAALHRLGAEFCLAERIVPVAGPDGRVRIATSRPDRFADLAPRLPPDWRQMEIAGRDAPENAVLAEAADSLTRMAEARTPDALSCRGFGRSRPGRQSALALAAGLGLALLAGLFALGAGLAALVMWTTLVIALQTGMKLAALAAASRPRRPGPPGRAVPRLPVVSILVALHREPETAPSLIDRLSRIDYPRALLDVLLVTEEDDTETRDALDAAGLPGWIRQVAVPPGTIRTKPRALNYALPLTRGEIVGVYDAEDSPAPGQIRDVVDSFRTAGPDIACVQCVLDYYRPRTNWLSRCFTAEYAVWFRVILPGLARLGLVVPLGGTSMFIRRAVLTGIGGWDAHNVTEDADLGLRLARSGYRTNVIASVTMEEPNCRPLPWIRQRSRWLKGYAMTWMVHMRRPARLWRDLGPWRFLGVQVLFLGTLSQFLLAPLLWAVWLAGPFGLAEAAGLLPPILLYILAAALDIAAMAWAVRGAGHRHLWPWLPTVIAYFPLATLAAWKGVAEIVRKPFFWDKTQHGILAAPPTGS